MAHPMKDQLNNLALCLFNNLDKNEEITLDLEGEETQFLRFNHSQVRQATHVEQWDLVLTYKKNQKTLSMTQQLSVDFAKNLEKCQQTLNTARQEIVHLPDDPFAIDIKNHGTSNEVFKGDVPSLELILADCAKLFEGSDLAGIFANGPICRGLVNSKGVNHWYQTEIFSFDYSLYFGDRAVKGCFAGKNWSAKDFAKQIQEKKSQLESLKRDKIKIKPGKYRCYLAPAAVSDIVAVMNWGGFSLAALKRGYSPLRELYESKKQLSHKFSVCEDFSLGYCRRFNSEGELSPEKVELIQEGKPVGLLTSSRSALEYSAKSNGANETEVAVSLHLQSGQLKEFEILERLNTGLYLSNVHYLNWSDRRAGRFTGMTRFACFWVENGEIQGPIEDLRFDENVFECFGDKLEDFTEFTEVHPEIHTYGSRHLGANKTPGMLVSEWVFTL